MKTPTSWDSTIQLLSALAGPDIIGAAIPLARERLKLTPEKVAILLVRLVNPDELVKKGEEATLRGVQEETLKSYKEERLFPEFLGAHFTAEGRRR